MRKISFMWTYNVLFLIHTYISFNDYGKLLNSDECRVNYSWSAHNTLRTYIRILLSSECKT